jgi:hypothetical protein
MSHIPLLSRRSSDFSPHVEKLTPDLTPQLPSLEGKGEQLKPLSLQERGNLREVLCAMERGFPDTVKSQTPTPYSPIPIYNF